MIGQIAKSLTSTSSQHGGVFLRQNFSQPPALIETFGHLPSRIGAFPLLPPGLETRSRVPQPSDTTAAEAHSWESLGSG